MLNIVLVEPEIPQNCGNIARTCAATGARLHLIRPLGFDISEKAVKRAGLDYWHLVEVRDYENLEDFFQKNMHIIIKPNVMHFTIVSNKWSLKQIYIQFLYNLYIKQTSYPRQRR